MNAGKMRDQWLRLYIRAQTNRDQRSRFYDNALHFALYYSAGGWLGSWPSWRVSAYMSRISWASQGRCLMFRRANMRAWAVIITSGGASVTWPNESGVVRKTRHVGGDKPVDHRADADGLAREYAGVDGGFGVIADHAAEELHAGIYLVAVVFHAHRAVGVFQVAVRGAGPQIDPTAQVAVAEKAVVLFVGQRFDDRGLDFAADFAGVPESDEIFERRVFDHPAMGADVDRSAEIAEGPDSSVLFQHNRPVGGIGDAVLSQPGPGCGEQAVGNLAIIAVRDPIGEVLLQNLHVPADQFVGILEHRQFYFQRSKMQPFEPGGEFIGRAIALRQGKFRAD